MPSPRQTRCRNAGGKLRQAEARDADRRAAPGRHTACEVVGRAARRGNDGYELVREESDRGKPAARSSRMAAEADSTIENVRAVGMSTPPGRCAGYPKRQHQAAVHWNDITAWLSQPGPLNHGSV